MAAISASASPDALHVVNQWLIQTHDALLRAPPNYHILTAARFYRILANSYARDGVPENINSEAFEEWMRYDEHANAFEALLHEDLASVPRIVRLPLFEPSWPSPGHHWPYTVQELMHCIQRSQESLSSALDPPIMVPMTPRGLRYLRRQQRQQRQAGR